MLLAALLATPAVAIAQSGAVRLGLASVRAGRLAPVMGERVLNGVGWSLDAAFGMGPATLDLRYLESGLSDAESGTDLDLVDGEIILMVAPLRWAAVGVGPHIRSYVQSGGTERWVLWELRARAKAELLADQIDGYVEGWLVVGADADVVEPFDNGRGLEGGLRLVFGRLPISARLRYRVERLNLGDGAREETVDQLGIAIGIGRR